MKETFLLIIAFVVALTTFGCAAYEGNSNVVILKDPKTHEFVDCQVDRWQSKKSYEENNKCVKEYLEKGYEIWHQR